jgi:hypothetical protein
VLRRACSLRMFYQAAVHSMHRTCLRAAVVPCPC